MVRLSPNYEGRKLYPPPLPCLMMWWQPRRLSSRLYPKRRGVHNRLPIWACKYLVSDMKLLPLKFYLKFRCWVKYEQKKLYRCVNVERPQCWPQYTPKFKVMNHDEVQRLIAHTMLAAASQLWLSCLATGKPRYTVGVDNDNNLSEQWYFTLFQIVSVLIVIQLFLNLSKFLRLSVWFFSLIFFFQFFSLFKVLVFFMYLIVHFRLTRKTFVISSLNWKMPFCQMPSSETDWILSEITVLANLVE